MKVNNNIYDINDLVEDVNINVNIPKKRKNGLVLRDSQIEVLNKYGINYLEYASINSLLFEIENILNEETDIDDLEWLSYELAEMNYYNYTNK